MSNNGVCWQVRARYAEQYDYEQISNLLGMDKAEPVAEDKDDKPGYLPQL